MTQKSNQKKGSSTASTSRKPDPNILEESKTPKAKAIATLGTVVPQIFMDAQRPNEHIRSDSIRLRDIQIACCLNGPRRIGEQEQIDYEGEEKFIKEVFRNINKVLPVKNKEPHADRVVRFIAGFLQYNQQRDVSAKEKLAEFNALKAKKAREEANTGDDPMEEDNRDEQEGERDDEENNASIIVEENEEDEMETVSSRFVEQLLRHLLRGFPAEKLSVRTRCCQIIALSISSMGEIDEDLYQDLKTALFERIQDKEVSVRIQAATALCRLQSADTDIDPTDGKTILQKLMWWLHYDPNPEVRRIILFNIDPVPETIRYIVTSARDTDDMNRRVVYLNPLSDIPDFRMLSSEERNTVLKLGLSDRDNLVRKSASKMLSEKWIAHANNNLIEFLERLEVMKPDSSEIAESVLNAFFTARLDIVNDIAFDAEFWKNLTAESAFLAKVLIKFLKKDQTMEERLDDMLPEVTRHAFTLKYYNDLYRSTNAAQQENTKDYEFITTQMLEIALCLDYADEVGRRKMFEILRDILRSCELTEDHLSKIIQIFRLISLDERDFTRTMIEIISDIQEQLDPFDDLEDAGLPAKRSKLDDDFDKLDTSFSSSTGNFADGGSASFNQFGSQRVLDSLVIRLRCLNICKRMLESCQESLNENSNLYGLLNDLIVPAVQSSDTALREEGIHCLGLCCLLDKALTQHNISLFIHVISNGHEEIMKKALTVLFDVMIKFGVQALGTQTPNATNDLSDVFEYCLDHDSAEVQSITTVGLSKLFLANRFQDEQILRLMILLYFFPTTAEQENSKTKQCLTYFFPAYCHSSASHQKSLSKVTIPALEELCNTFNDLENDETMADPMKISEMLVDWTDSRKLARSHINDIRRDGHDTKSDVPGVLAIESLKSIYNEPTGIRRKSLCHFLLRLHLNDQDETQLIEIQKLLNEIATERPIKEHLTRKAFIKLSTSLDIIIEEYRKERGIVDDPKGSEPVEEPQEADGEQECEEEEKIGSVDDDNHTANDDTSIQDIDEDEEDDLGEEISMEITGLDDDDKEDDSEEEQESSDEEKEEMIAPKRRDRTPATTKRRIIQKDDDDDEAAEKESSSIEEDEEEESEYEE